MRAKRPTLVRLLASMAVACCLAVATMVMPASADDTQAYVKYYLVASAYQGQPENLTEIAQRFLGSGTRSADIYNLNAGRAQADGSSLTDGNTLHAGWYLVLPWDAAGDGVKYGQIPTGATPTPTSTKKTSKPTKTPNSGSKPSPSSAKPTKSTSCATTTGSSSKSDWAQLRMAVDSAWDVSRGNGVMVAVIDSGVDGTLDSLSGRLSPGADVTVGNGKGTTDCLGTGTAMASIIAANATSAKTPVGMAPDATILPVRMVSTTATGRAADAANAIEVAVSAGASVLTLGSYVDLSAPEVLTALTTALNHDVIVVAGAPTKPITLPSPSDSSATGALLLVGGVDADNKLVEAYQQDSVEVIAPGADVAAIGPGKSGALSYTGTQYATAFVAGEAALVRAAYPELAAVQVEQRITGTSDAVADATGLGSGMINPAASVAKAVDGEAPAATAVGDQEVASSSSGGGSKRGLAAFLCLGVVLIAGGIVLWTQRMKNRD
ncbi:S8 family serine peptidase [Actinoplanes sp. NPDC051851]|uniref:S8 family serine peptidase n=1 Tax=Actinoplanes sp. NPDC051851 TaxID=3154753 RepID=UPI00343BAF10